MGTGDQRKVEGDPQGLAGRGLTPSPDILMALKPYDLGSLGGCGERGELLLFQGGDLV